MFFIHLLFYILYFLFFNANLCFWPLHPDADPDIPMGLIPCHSLDCSAEVGQLSYPITSRWQVCAHFTQTLIEHLLFSDTRYSDCFSHLRERRVAKLTSSHVSILMCEKWYWDQDLTSSDWKYRKTEYRGRQFYLHWIYNKIIRDFKMRSK